MYSKKGQRVLILGFSGQTVCHNYSTLQVQQGNSLRQDTGRQAWLCPTDLTYQTSGARIQHEGYSLLTLI